MNSEPSGNDNPFHRHSMLLALLAALVVLTTVGSLTHWRVEWIALYVIATPLSFLLFARLFYGFRASHALDREETSPGSGWSRRDDLGQAMPNQLFDAYQKAQDGDISGLRHLAEEEEAR